MSEGMVVSPADLSAIEDALRTIGGNLSEVNSEISEVNSGINVLNGRQVQLESDLATLAREFSDFVEADLKIKNLQLAETRVGNLRQELQIKYGYYAEIRRMATGILQGIETNLVGNETVKYATEEVMIKAPGYWLAPALVALASWIRDERLTCDSALVECLKRDDYKSSLFFMLLTRRLGRNDASLTWLERYFAHQNPKDLDREFITVLEAVTTGVFHPASRIVMMKYVKSWLDKLMQGDQFINEQKNQWAKYFEASKPALQDGIFPLLKKYSKNWDILEESLRDVKSQDIIDHHFKSILSSSNDFSSSVKSKLDEILSLLVTNFDDEELPLQKQVRLNQLIIEKSGDKASAQAVMNAEENIFKEKVDFLQMLTNAAFNPEATGVTKVTQALAVSISQPWIIEAYDTFTAQYRNKFPMSVEIAIEGFSASTKNGSDEKEQLSKHSNYFTAALQKELKGITFPIGGVILGVLIGMAGFVFSTVAGFISLAIGGVMIWKSINNVNLKKNKVKAAFEEKKRITRDLLRGCLAETVDYRKELGVEDSKAENVRQLLNSITPQDFSSISKDTARNLI